MSVGQPERETQDRVFIEPTGVTATFRATGKLFPATTSGRETDRAELGERLGERLDERSGETSSWPESRLVPRQGLMFGLGATGSASAGSPIRDAKHNTLLELLTRRTRFV